MKRDADASDAQSGQLPTYKKVLLAILGALALMVVVNMTRGAGADGDVDVKVDVHHDVEETHEVVARVFNNLEDAHVRVHVLRHVGHADDQRMIDQRFAIGDEARLMVRVGDADVELRTAEGREMHVEVFLRGTDMERARAYFERQEFDVYQDGNEVVVRTAEHTNGGGWRDRGGAHIRVVVHTPAAIDADIRTSDGDITASELRGVVRLTTSDGDIGVDRLEGAELALRTSDGDIRADLLDAATLNVVTSDGDISVGTAVAGNLTVRTSDGDIRLSVASGDVSLTTSDGDISVGELAGEEASLRTSDGDISVSEAGGDRVEASTSDGSIRLRGIRGDIRARTSSGDLDIDILEAGDLDLHTSDGDIVIAAPRDVRASLSLRGDQVRIASGFAFDGVLKKEEADGRINGGGSRFDARASNGEIVLREQ